MRPSLIPLFLLAALAAAPPSAAQNAARTEEIPLERCDRLPTIPVRAAGRDWRFLLDTAATTTLNIKSFADGKSTEIKVTSWSGTAATSAKEISLPEISVGGHTVQKLKLPAVDLTVISKACGGPIDGILGVDLIERLGLKIDVKRNVASVGDAAGGSEPADLKALRQEVEQSESACVAAFNRGDAAGFVECLDPDFVLFTPWGEYRGRGQVMDYIKNRYFKPGSSAKYKMTNTYFRFAGATAFHGYDYSIEFPDHTVTGRGTSVCQKTDGQWRILNMHHSIVQADPSQKPAP